MSALPEPEELHRKVSYLPDLHRMLPQAADAERGVLCSFLLAPREVGELCIEKGITASHFHLPAHGTIYTVLMEFWHDNEPIDFISLCQWMRNLGTIDQVGGDSYVTELFTFLPTAANCGYYLEILREKFTLREIIKTCTEYAARSYDEQHDVEALLEGAERGILAIRRGTTDDMSTVTAKDGAMGAIAAIEAFYERRGQITGIPTGFPELDKMLDGFRPGQLIVVAGRPSMGKTAIGMNMAEHIAIESGQPVAFFSLEMSSQELHTRMLCSRAKVNMHRVREGFLADRDFPALTSAATKIAESQLLVVDATGANIIGISAHSRRLHKRHTLAAIFVDYLQLVRSTSKQAQNNREREIAEISNGLKNLSKELGLPVVVLAQLNREVDKRTGDGRGRPRLSDLRESGAIEQDADVIAFLTREEYYAETEEAKREAEGKATLIIAKQRNGPIGDIPLTFLKEYARFESRARETFENPKEPDEQVELVDFGKLTKSRPKNNR